MPPPPVARAAAAARPATPDDLKRLEQTLLERVAAQPGSGMHWQQLAGIYAQTGRHQQAVEAFGKAAEGGASIAAVAIPWAISLSTLGRHNEAVDVLMPVHAKRQKDFALANTLGVMLKRAGRLNEAVAPLELARKLEPRNASPCQNLGNVQELRGDFAAAAAAFGAGLKLDPRSAEMWRLYGRMQRALGDTEGSIVSFEKSLSLDPRNKDVAVILNGLLLDRGEFDRADAAIAKSRAALPDDPLPEVMEARVMLRRGKATEAIARLDAVVEKWPTDRNANMLLARIHGDGDRRKANEALERALAAEPNNPEVMDALVESLSRSRYDSEVASASLGIRIGHVKFAVYVAVAGMTAMVGSLIALQKIRTSPDAAFSVNDWTAFVIFIVVIGGIGTIEGPIIGAVIYFALLQSLSQYGTLYMLLLGVVAVIMVTVAPKGIWGFVAKRWNISLFPVRRRLVLEAPPPDVKPEKPDAAVAESV
jgi:Flp pilus assembly protein TadD